MADSQSSKQQNNQFFNQLKELGKDFNGDSRSIQSRRSSVAKQVPFERLKPSVPLPYNERFRQLDRLETPSRSRHLERREFTIFAYSEYQERRKIEEEIRKIRQELYLVIKEMEKLGADIKESQIAIQQEIINPGVYHLNFFQKLLAILRVLRQNIHESKNWLEMVFHKKSKRRYWSMAKGGGSKFTMSHERRMATQAG